MIKKMGLLFLINFFSLNFCWGMEATALSYLKSVFWHGYAQLLSSPQKNALLLWYSQNYDKLALLALLHADADPNSRDLYGTSAVMYVAQKGDLEMLKNFKKKGGNVLAKNPHRRTVLSYAAENGKIDVIAWCITKGCSVNEVSIHGFSPLHYACKKPDNKNNNKEEAVHFLLQQGAHIEAETTFQRKTPLLYASEQGNPETIQILLDYQADLSKKDIDGKNCLLSAVSSYNSAVVKYLLFKLNSSPYVQDAIGFTPLMYTAANGVDTIKEALLLLATGNPQKLLAQKNNNGLNAQSIAEKNWNNSFLELIKDEKRIEQKKEELIQEAKQYYIQKFSTSLQPKKNIAQVLQNRELGLKKY